MLPAVATLCLEARGESNLGVQVCSNDTEALVRQLTVFSSLEGGHIVVAEHRGDIAGFALLRLLTNDILRPSPAVFIEALYVKNAERRMGVGRALMAHIADFAVGNGVADIYAQQLPGARGTNRFLARLGFAPAAAHRVVAVSALQRELAREPGIRRRARGIEDLIARRRKVRVHTESIDSREVERRLRSKLG
ncbi:acetyltransferase (GNAT) family protein [Rarobacter incanus]|uniref:Acetyltransferase (GNAT) family protein n=2 Tax=Rarobacter incanus TaxID=153494 RepID=A0A542SM35_9MICO|nr:acetyltransferase (GNAT) family protein [Rarobacter incanus]